MNKKLKKHISFVIKHKNTILNIILFVTLVVFITDIAPGLISMVDSLAFLLKQQITYGNASPEFKLLFIFGGFYVVSYITYTIYSILIKSIH